jgi:5-methylcytosine-specific restriction endonuclease McrA
MSKQYNGGEWTKSRFESFIKSALRSASQRWGPKFASLQDAFVDKRINPKSGRLGKHYKCNACEGIFPSAEVQVDHIHPAVPITGFTTWDEVIELMFCEKDGFQVLCKDCHSIKTKQENAERKLYASTRTKR